ncbi:MAG: peptidoglycan editing factor PgeF [Pseudomonadota bacterium]|nr:peptidoglycan editing factor PgeF [Pseudomonadota bacterium]
MNDWIAPDWPAPSNVKALFTTRNGGVSSGPYTSLNLGGHVGDDPSTVIRNRALLRRILPSEPRWLRQVHGTAPVRVDDYDGTAPCDADAAFSQCAGNVCAVLVADCLPVLLCDHAGTVVGVIHAGWRGMVEGVIERTVSEIGQTGCIKTRIMAWLGPAIGPHHFEVGDEVRQAFVERDKKSALAFMPHHAHSGKWLADLFLLARQRLIKAGVAEIYGGNTCTFSEPARFFSYRRDGNTGRMAGLIWLTNGLPEGPA